LRLYGQRRAEMHCEDHVLDVDYPQTVATTWELAIDTLPASGRALLNLMCWWAPEAIPLPLLLDGIPGEPLSDTVAETVRPLLIDELERNRAISALNAASLTTPTSPAGAVNVHRLVQAVTRDQLGAAAEPWTLAAARLVVHALPDPPATLATLTRWNGL